MGNWIVHIVGETIDDDIAPIITKAIDEIQKLNHRVKQVRFTTDAGERVIHIAEKVEADAAVIDKDIDAVAPSLAPEADAVAGVVEAGGKEVEKVVGDIETAEGTPLPSTPPATPPVSSATPAADPTATPVVPAPVDPPLAGASSTGSSPTSTDPTPVPPSPIPSS